MKNFRFTKPRGTQSVALVVTDTVTGVRSAKIYEPDELYPLQSERYYSNLPNLFVDVLDLVDGYGPDFEPVEKPEKIENAPSITLRTMTRRAQREAADGSGNARRFTDAKNLWNIMEKHIISAVLTPSAEPITDVRKSKNWRKNQPFAHVRIDPQAWFVSNVFSRSSQQKDPISVYKGISALFETLMAELDDVASAPLQELRAGITDNLNFPEYQRIAQALDDSNMLVFHNDESLAAWIRKAASEKEYLVSGTPAVVHLVSSAAALVPGDDAGEASKVGVASGATVTVSNLANRIAPKKA